METSSSSATATEQPQLTLTRIIDAPRELVFKWWTDPAQLASWWGPDGFTVPVCELDVRPGGALLVHMQAPDGTVFPMTGTFHEVVPPERLVFSSSAFEDEAGNGQLVDLNTVTLVERDGKTELTVHTVVTKWSPEVVGALDGMEEGWNQTLDRLVAMAHNP